MKYLFFLILITWCACSKDYSKEGTITEPYVLFGVSPRPGNLTEVKYQLRYPEFAKEFFLMLPGSAGVRLVVNDLPNSIFLVPGQKDVYFLIITSQDKAIRSSKFDL